MLDPKPYALALAASMPQAPAPYGPETVALYFPLATAALVAVLVELHVTPCNAAPVCNTPDDWALHHIGRREWAQELLFDIHDSDGGRATPGPYSASAVLECWLAQHVNNHALFVDAVADSARVRYYAESDSEGGADLCLDESMPADVAAMLYRAFVVFIMDDLGDSDLVPLTA